MASLHDFTVIDIEGNPFELSQLNGKKVMVVNTASECGFTSQYEQMEELYSSTDRDRFEIVAFPANNFGGQEPGSNEQIAEFCRLNFDVSFPLMEKISVKGEDQHPVYQFLTSKEQNGVTDVEMVWNFQKLLVDENGQFVKSLSPDTLPIDDEILTWINE